jgi:YhcH/YjgK/YiaL family protein
MILDSLQNAARYFPLNPHFKAAFDFIAKTDLDSLPEGRVEIDGDNLFAFVAKPEGRRPEDAPLEAHRQYIDIQICLMGTDNIAWKALQDCESISEPYKEENDIMFFSDAADASCAIRRGQFAIFSRKTPTPRLSPTNSCTK